MKRINEIQTGMFVAIGLFLFALSVFTLGKERQIFEEQASYFASFSDVKGLSKGAPVRLGGIAIGRVSEIGFSKDLSDPLVHVELLVNESYLDRIRKDSLVTIETQGLLGDRFLSISAGTGDQLLPGGLVQAKEQGDIAETLTRASKIIDNAKDISELVTKVLQEFREDTLKDINKAAKSIAAIAKGIESGDGLAHEMVFAKSKVGEGLVQSLTASAKSLENILKEMEVGNGLMHQLVYEGTDEPLDGVAKKISKTVDNLYQASEALSRGSGTIGALMVDSSLYDNLVEVTDGAKRSFILRQAIRSSLEQQ